MQQLPGQRSRWARNAPESTSTEDTLPDDVNHGVLASTVYHLVDPRTGNGLSVAVFDHGEAAQAAGAAIRPKGLGRLTGSLGEEHELMAVGVE